MKTDRNIDRGFYIAGWVLIAAAIVYAGFTKLTGIHLMSYYPPCAFRLLTGYNCPGCGGTRAVRALLSGNLVASVKLHPFVPYTALLGSWFMISQTIERISCGKIKIGMHFHMVYLWIALVIIVVNWIVQNILLFTHAV